MYDGTCRGCHTCLKGRKPVHFKHTLNSVPVPGLAAGTIRYLQNTAGIGCTRYPRSLPATRSVRNSSKHPRHGPAVTSAAGTIKQAQKHCCAMRRIVIATQAVN